MGPDETRTDSCGCGSSRIGMRGSGRLVLHLWVRSSRTHTCGSEQLVLTLMDIEQPYWHMWVRTTLTLMGADQLTDACGSERHVLTLCGSGAAVSALVGPDD